MNPYDWQRNTPLVPVPRRELAPALARLRRGGSAVILGGRGMGKSVLLRQIQAAASELPGVKTFLSASPPTGITAEECLRVLAQALGVEKQRVFSARELFAEYRTRNGDGSNLILLFDGLDHYAQNPGMPDCQVAGRQFFSDLETARRNLPGIGIAVAGGMGVFVLREPYGAGFLSRAEQFLLAPFQRAELAELAHSFAEVGRPLDDQALDALHRGSGGHPALATFALKELWDDRTGRPAADLISKIFAKIQEDVQGFLGDAEQIQQLARQPVPA